MAQAARLSLRMQKELKLLQSDPPPGASFPLLTGTDNGGSVASSSNASLSVIDAEIEGPEGTVYAGGIFTIKIQIPERYPFQPPNVTFATPIYHPNIDNGGRICLDILNLPPKGAWQPSLNIFTVITSIGLLLSEPNPDDGLMCEASKEYKYNRQVFNLKARTMTERHAKPGCCAMSGSNQSISSTVNMDYEEAVGTSKHDGAKGIEGQRKPLTSKLSLNFLITSAAKGDHGGGEVKDEPANPSSVVFETEKDNPPSNSRKRTYQEPSWVESKSGLSRRRLSLNCSRLPKIEHDSSSTVVNSEVPSSSLSGSNEILAADDSQFDDPSPQVSSLSKPNAKKSATGRKLSLGFSVRALHKNYAVDEKENLKPVSVNRSSLESPQSSEKPSFSFNDEILDRELGTEKSKPDQLLATETVDELQDQGRDARKHRDASSSGRPVLSSSVSAEKHNYSDNRTSENFHGAQRDSKPEAAPPPVSVIVLDSDDSDEERNVCKRPRLSMSRKRYSSKGTNIVKHC